MLATVAPAKINWTLEVLGRRPDGYHEIASLMSTVSLCDELTLVPAQTWRVTVDAPPAVRAELESANNLVCRAIDELRARLRPLDTVVPPAHLHLIKRIPAGAGLGGGSSDAAAALRLLFKSRAGTQAWRLTSGMLLAIAARLGADVPFFVAGGTSHVRGRGERLERVSDLVGHWVVLLTPPISLEQKTRRLYGMIGPEDYTDGSRTRAIVERWRTEGQTAITEHDLFNVFERVAPTAFPGIERFRSLLTEATGSPAHLCGAGPTVFALSPNAGAAQGAAQALREQGVHAWAVHTIRGEEATRVVSTLSRT